MIIKRMRMKRLVMLFTFLCILGADATAAEATVSEKSQTIMGDIFPMIEGPFEGYCGYGLFYERRISRVFSALIENNLYTNFKEDITWGVVAHGRVYPFRAAIGGLFFDIGTGYRRNKRDEDNVHCVVSSLTTGWKFIADNGLTIEPSLGAWYNVYTLTGNSSVNLAPIVGLAFGWSF